MCQTRNILIYEYFERKSTRVQNKNAPTNNNNNDDNQTYSVNLK